LVGLVPNP